MQDAAQEAEPPAESLLPQHLQHGADAATGRGIAKLETWGLAAFEAVRSTARKGETAGEIVEEKAESADNRAPKASGVQSTLLIERQCFTTHWFAHNAWHLFSGRNN